MKDDWTVTRRTTRAFSHARALDGVTKTLSDSCWIRAIQMLSFMCSQHANYMNVYNSAPSLPCGEPCALVRYRRVSPAPTTDKTVTNTDGFESRARYAHLFVSHPPPYAYATFYMCEAHSSAHADHKVARVLGSTTSYDFAAFAKRGRRRTRCPLDGYLR